MGVGEAVTEGAFVRAKAEGARAAVLRAPCEEAGGRPGPVRAPGRAVLRPSPPPARPPASVEQLRGQLVEEAVAQTLQAALVSGC